MQSSAFHIYPLGLWMGRTKDLFTITKDLRERERERASTLGVLLLLLELTPKLQSFKIIQLISSLHLSRIVISTVLSLIKQKKHPNTFMCTLPLLVRSTVLDKTGQALHFIRFMHRFTSKWIQIYVRTVKSQDIFVQIFIVPPRIYRSTISSAVRPWSGYDPIIFNEQKPYKIYDGYT